MDEVQGCQHYENKNPISLGHVLPSSLPASSSWNSPCPRQGLARQLLSVSGNRQEPRGCGSGSMTPTKCKAMGKSGCAGHWGTPANITSEADLFFLLEL